MQISTQEVNRVVQQTAERAASRKADAPVRSVEELAAKHGVKMEEVRRFTESAMMAEEDPLRERRLRELADRIARGAYNIEGEQIVDMAERRALADRATDL